MNISDIPWLTNKNLHNAEFSTIGHVLGTGQNRLVPITSEPDLRRALNSSEICGVIVSEEISIPHEFKKGVIISQDPLLIALKIKNELENPKKLKLDPTSIHPSAVIHPTAKIAGFNVSIEKDVEIGEHVIIHQGCKIGNNSTIGPNSCVGSNPCIGDNDPFLDDYISSGFVEIHNEVSIHANCVIERPIFNDVTKIGSRCHIDNLVTIRQGAIIDELSLITANSEIGDYAKIGKDCWIGLRAMIGRGVQIGNSSYVTLGSTTSKNISEGMVVRDNWAISRKRFKGMIT